MTSVASGAAALIVSRSRWRAARGAGGTARRYAATEDAFFIGALVRRQIRYVDDGPDLDRAAAGHGNPRRDGDRLVEIPRIDQEIAPQLLLGLRKRTVGHHPLAVAYPDAGGRGGRLERGGG